MAKHIFLSQKNTLNGYLFLNSSASWISFKNISYKFPSTRFLTTALTAFISCLLLLLLPLNLIPHIHSGRPRNCSSLIHPHLLSYKPLQWILQLNLLFLSVFNITRIKRKRFFTRQSPLNRIFLSLLPHSLRSFCHLLI